MSGRLRRALVVVGSFGTETLYERDIRIQVGGLDASARQALNGERDPYAGGAGAFKRADVTLALKPHANREGFLRQAEFFAEGGDVHARMFAYAEHLGKVDVRHMQTDVTGLCLHTPNMTAKPRKSRPPEVYEDYRSRSGWYLAAWRDYAGLTLEDLAAELGRSKGYISDLETGAVRTGRPATRFNRDLIEQVAGVVGTTGGRLIDVNPFNLNEQMERLSSVIARLDEAGQQAVLSMAESWAGRTGTDG